MRLELPGTEGRRSHLELLETRHLQRASLLTVESIIVKTRMI